MVVVVVVSYLSVCLSVCLSASLKIKQFCETYSTFARLTQLFELDNIKNEAILRDFRDFGSWQHQKRSNSARRPSKMESWVQSWRPPTKAFCDFSTTCLKHCTCHEQLMPGHTKCCTCHAKSSHQTYRFDAPKCSRNMSLVLHLPRKMHLCISSANVPRLPWFWKCSKTLTFCSLLTRCTIPCACHAKQHLNFKSAPNPSLFFNFWLQNVLRATTAYTFSTCQLPKVVRAWCGLMFCTFWRGNALRATAAYTFSASQLPWCVLKHSESWLSAHLHLLSSHSFSFLIFSLLLFSSLTLLTSAFPSVHTVGSLTSRLPSTIPPGNFI